MKKNENNRFLHNELEKVSIILTHNYFNSPSIHNNNITHNMINSN